MSSHKLKLLAVVYRLAYRGSQAIFFAGIFSGLEHLVSSELAFGITFIYMFFFLGTYRRIYGLIPASIGAIVDVGILKTLLFYWAPLSAFSLIILFIEHYSLRQIRSSKMEVLSNPDFDNLVKVIQRLNPGVVQDSTDQLQNTKTVYGENQNKD